nr:hypothetical protein [Candidatus Cloacimonadota bacterium]
YLQMRCLAFNIKRGMKLIYFDPASGNASRFCEWGLQKGKTGSKVNKILVITAIF